MITWIGIGVVLAVDAVLIFRNEKKRAERKAMLERMEFESYRNN